MPIQDYDPNSGLIAGFDFRNPNYIKTPFGFVGDPGAVAARRMGDAGVPNEFSNPAVADAIRAGIAAPSRGNPYDYRAATAMRPDTLAALDALHNGPSAVAPMVNRSFNGAVTGTSNAVANAGGGLQAALAGQSALNPMSQLADQAGAGRLQEFMGQQSAYGAGLGQIRGQDQAQARGALETGLEAQNSDDILHRFYVNQGMNYDEARRRTALDNFKLRQKLKLAQEKANVKTAGDVAEGAGTLIKAVS